MLGPVAALPDQAFVLVEIEKTGKTFLICRNGKPVAEMIPYKRPSRLAYHPTLSKIGIAYDPVEGLSEEESTSSISTWKSA